MRFIQGIWLETNKQPPARPQPSFKGKQQKQLLFFISTKCTSPKYKEKHMLDRSVIVDSRCCPKAKRGSSGHLAIKPTLEESSKEEESKNLGGGHDEKTILCVFRQALIVNILSLNLP